MKPLKELLPDATKDRCLALARVAIARVTEVMGLLVLVTLIGGCRGTSTEELPSEGASVEFLIQQPTQRKLDIENLALSHPVAAMQFDDPREADRWKASADEATVVEAGALRVIPDSSRLRLIGRVGWNVSEADRERTSRIAVGSSR